MVNDPKAGEMGAQEGGEKPDYRPEKEGSGTPEIKPETKGGDAEGMPKEKPNE
jgi:hypothetical protein